MEQIKISKHLMIRARLRLTLPASAETNVLIPLPPPHPDQEGVLVKDEIPSETAPRMARSVQEEVHVSVACTCGGG